MDTKARGQRLLEALCRDKYDDALKILQQPVDFTAQRSGDNALHMAARKGRLDLIKAMVERGADIKQKNQNGNTVAHYAAKEGYLDILQYTKKLRGDLNSTNNDGNAPLHAAVINLPMDVIEILVDFGMNPNITNRLTGETPLHTATAYGRLPAMEGLLLKGGVPDVKDKQNRRPEDVARSEDLKQTMVSYSSMYAALSTGFVQATGMQLTPDSVTSPLHIQRVGIIIESLDLPREFPTNFYCRRERSENSTVPIKPRDEEYIFSDVFHIQVSDVMKDCKARMYLPIYQKPPEKEQLVLRFVGQDAKGNDDKVIEEIETFDNVPHCLAETTLIPETTCVCLVYSRPRQESNSVLADGTLIRSVIEKNFLMDVPAETFTKPTTLSLKIYASNTDDQPTETTTAKTNPRSSLKTDVFQVNVSEQPTNPIKMQLPTVGANIEPDNLAIVWVDENRLEDNDYLPEVVPVVPTVVNTNIVFEVSHFCVYVAAPKTSTATDEELRSLKRQIRDAKLRRKPATFLALCKAKKATSRKHTLLVECGLEKRQNERLEKWQGKGYEKCENCQSGMIMLAPGDTFTVDVKGAADFENKSNSVKQRVTFSQCRSSFQAFAVLLDKKINRAEDADAEVGAADFENKSNSVKQRVTFSQCRSSFQAFAVLLDKKINRAEDAEAEVGAADFENKSNSVKQRVTFSQCRSSFQAFAVLLDKKINRAEDAEAEVVIYKQNGKEREEVFTLNAQLHIPTAAAQAAGRGPPAQQVQFELIEPSDTAIGGDINVGVIMRNVTKVDKTCTVRMTLASISGSEVNRVKEEKFEVTLESKMDEQVMMTVTAKEYEEAGIKHDEFNLTTHCTVAETNEMFISVEKFSLQKPTLTLECDDSLAVGSKSTAKLSFKNSTNLSLHGGVFNFTANSIADPRKNHIKTEIAPGETVGFEVPLNPRRVGKWPMSASFSATELSEITEVKVISVTK